MNRKCRLLLLATLVLVSPVLSQTADSFNPGTFNGAVYALAPQADGSLIAGGDFTTVGGSPFVRLVRFHPDGTVDRGFTASASNTVYTLATQADGKVIVGGAFTSINGQTRSRLARLNIGGSLDGDFNPGASNDVNVIVVQPDGKILVGGSFANLAGIGQRALGRLNLDGSLDTNFNPLIVGLPESISAIAVQEDGKIVIAGSWFTVNGSVRNRIARLHSNGALDADFNPNVVGTAVYCSAVQPDGRIVIGGIFTSVGGQSRQNIARLNADGSLDVDFNPGANSAVRSVAIQADGKILVGGAFTTLAGQTRQRIGRLNSDGSADNFNPGASSTVHGLALQADGKILAGGLFGTLGGSSRSRLGRLNNDTAATQSLNSDGSTITWLRGGSSPEVARVTFDQCLNGIDWSELGSAERVAGGWQLAGLAVSTNATIRARGFVVGGYNNASGWFVEKGVGPLAISIPPADQRSASVSLFTGVTFNVTPVGNGPFTYQWYNNNTAMSGQTNSWLWQYAPYASSVVNYSVVVSDATRSVRIPAKIWGPELFRTADGPVYALAVQPDGMILVGGAFTNSPGSRIARLTPAGGIDSTFDPGVSAGAVYALAVQTDGKILVGGTFTNLAGQSRTGLGRLNRDGSLDAAFNPTVSGPVVKCLAIQQDGKILVGGLFMSLAGQTRFRIGRLNSDGSLDNGFVEPDSALPSGLEAGVTSMAVHSDGRILVCGEIREPQPNHRTFAQWLNPDGSLERRLLWTSTASGSLRYVSSAVLQPDGGILLGGWMEQPPMYRNLIRFDSTGAMDTNYPPVSWADGPVYSLAAQADGKIVVGGWFTSLAGEPCINLGRLNPDGRYDGGFEVQSSVTGSGVYSLAVQPDGNMLYGGSFNQTLGGSSRRNLGKRILSDTATQSLSWNGSDISWQRGGLSPEVLQTHFEASTNGLDWMDLGEGARVPGGWQLSNVPMPEDALIRARGFVGGNSSHWFTESLLPTAPAVPPIILAGDDNLRFHSNRFGFNYTGSFGHVAVVEASTNFIHWTPVDTNRLYGLALFFSDARSTNFSQRFYRARLQ